MLFMWYEKKQRRSDIKLHPGGHQCNMYYHVIYVYIMWFIQDLSHV